MSELEYNSRILEKVRNENPLIHNITNVVVTNFTANGLLALGASPVMASAVQEVAEMAKLARALVLNIGTLEQKTVDAMLIAGKAANEAGVPVLLDPVGAGATAFRTATVQHLLEKIKIKVLRGNAAEIANIIGRKWEIKGVDGASGEGNIVELAQTAAKRFRTVVAITGEEDIVTDGTNTFIIQNGHPLLTKVTGAGCLLTAIIGAFTAVSNDVILSVVTAIAFYGIAAEKAAAKTSQEGPGSFQIELLNQLSKVSVKDIENHAKIIAGGTRYVHE